MARPDPALLNAARYPFVTHIGTRYADLDPNEHVNNVALAAMMEDARVRFIDATGVRAEMAGVRYMVASHATDFIAQAHYPDGIDCHCATAVVGRTSLTILQMLTQSSVAVALARTVMMCTDGARPVPLSDKARALLAPWILT